MKNFMCLILVLVFVMGLSGQEKGIQYGHISTYFKETETAAKKNSKLWGRSLYGPILLVDTETRQIYANMPDSAGELRASESIYTGTFPANRHLANTSVHWNGTDWAMVMLPLPGNKYDRIGLLIHELFHVVQQRLRLPQSNNACNHLDTRDGRVYLRLELEALKQAVSTPENSEKLLHLTNAFAFRKYRQSLFPDAGNLENDLELNEGMAEYTGEASCGRPEKEKANHFIQNIDLFMHNPTFVRSFAYQTIPVYGYLLDKTQRGWNKKISEVTDLTAFFVDAFHLIITTCDNQSYPKHIVIQSL